MQRQSWVLGTASGPVHSDLPANDVIQDPFHRLGELGCRWIDEADGSTAPRFTGLPTIAPPRRAAVRRAGTVSVVYLNGEEIATHYNMHFSLELEVTDRLQVGENELRLDFRSAVRPGQERRAAYVAGEGLPTVMERFDERALVRKAAYLSARDWAFT